MTDNYEELLMNLSARSDTYSLVASVAIRTLIDERDRMHRAMRFILAHYCDQQVVRQTAKESIGESK